MSSESIFSLNFILDELFFLDFFFLDFFGLEDDLLVLFDLFDLNDLLDFDLFLFIKSF